MKHGGKRPNSGCKPTCLCGKCKKCKHRAASKRYYLKMKVSDKKLDKRIEKFFKEKGWD